jgi:hypothetical protein
MNNPIATKKKPIVKKVFQGEILPILVEPIAKDNE